MSSAVKGKTLSEASEIFKRFHQMITGGQDPCFDLEDLGKLAAFSGVSAFPVRVKCASLAWHTLNAAMHETTSGPTNGGEPTKDPQK